MQINWATQSYKHPSLPISAQRCVNFYAEAQPQSAKSQVAVIGAPGLVLWVTVGTGPIRGMTSMTNSSGVQTLYVVSGLFLYSVSTAGVVTQLGGTIAGSQMLSIANNGTQVCIVNGSNGYIYSAAAGFQLISSPSFNPASVVVFFDTFFVFNKVGTDVMFVSASQDGTTFNALAFAAATVQPTQIVSLINQQENLFVFTQKNIETWYDAGSFPFPFARYDGATIERGCAATLTPVKEDNSVFFLGDDLIFYRLNGIIPVRISTHAIEAAWRLYSTVSDAYTFTYSFEGHKFITLTFPTANATWVYDVSTNLWHERVSWDQNNNTMGRWRGSCYANFNNMDLVGDATNGNLGILSPTSYTEYGNTIHGELISPPIHSDRKRIFHTILELDMETGVGLPTGQGSNPQVMLSWSNDQGRTYVPLQEWNTLGQIGAYQTRLRWLRLGQSRQRYYKMVISDPVRRVLIASNVFMSVGEQ